MAVFLGEERSANQDLLLMDVQTSYKTLNHIDIVSGGYLSGSYSSTSSNSTIQLTSRVGLVDNYFELWDYIGGTRFRGFIAERKGHRGLFAFFDQEVLGHNLKPRSVHFVNLPMSATDMSVVCWHLSNYAVNQKSIVLQSIFVSIENC